MFRRYLLIAILAILGSLGFSLEQTWAVVFPSTGPSGSYSGWAFGVYFQNLITNACPSGQAIVSFSTGTSNYGQPNCTTVTSSETDPEVGSNTANFLSKWNGSALVTSAVYESGGNVGIGNSSPAYKLEVSWTGSFSWVRLPTGASNGAVLVSDATGNASWQTISTSASSLTGSLAGTTNYIPKYTSSTTLWNSQITDNGTNVNITNDAYINGVTVWRWAWSIVTNTLLWTGSMIANTTGNQNTVVWYQAYSTSTGWVGNTMIWFQAGAAHKNGTWNTAVWWQSMASANVSWQDNISMGRWSLQQLTSWNYNVAIGSSAWQFNTAGSSNISIWYEAWRYTTTGNSNVSIWAAALRNNSGGSNNIGIWTSVAYFNTVGSSLIGMGNMALYSNQSGNFNIGIGDYSLTSNTTWVQNTAIGPYSLYTNSGGYSNVALWYQALYSNDIGYTNVAIGYRAGYTMTWSSVAGKVIIGTEAASSANSAIDVAIGASALRYSNTSYYTNFAIGLNALGGPNLTGGRNMAIGGSALYSNTTGTDNTAVWFWAMTTNSWWSSNTALWVAVLNSNTSGNNNVAMGREALYFNTTGWDNTAIGYFALHENKTGVKNTGVGNNALMYTTWSNNTGLGDNVLYTNTGWSNNVAVWQAALYTSKWNSNTALWQNAGYNLTSWDSNIFIGYNVQPNVWNTSSNQLNIGNWIYGNSGNIGIWISNPSQKLEVNGEARINTLTVWKWNGQLSGNTAFWVSALNSASGAPSFNGALRWFYVNPGTYNVAVGEWAMQNNTTGFWWVAIGKWALQNNTVSAWNVAIGWEALYNNAGDTTNDGGTYNIAIGWRAMYWNTLWQQNVAIGWMGSNSTGSYNVGVGVGSMGWSSTGSNNVAVGTNAWGQNYGGHYNTAIWWNAGKWAWYTNSNNTIIWYNAWVLLQTSSNNTFLWYQAGSAVTTGWNNILLWYQAGDAVTTGSKNIVIGYDIDTPSTSSNNILNIGNLIYATNLTTTGTTVGTWNVGIGTSSPSYRLEVSWWDALINNVRIWTWPWNNFTNVIVWYALPSSTGYDNTSVGYYNLPSNTTGYDNSAFGNGVMWTNTTGNWNTALWVGALYSNATGSNNTVIGNQAWFGISWDNNIIIWANTELWISNKSNYLNIGNWIYWSGWNIGIGNQNPTAMLEVAWQIKITWGSPWANKVLTSDAAGLASWQTPGLSGGQANYIARWTSGTALGTGSMVDSWSSIWIGTSTPWSKLDLRGQFRLGYSGWTATERLTLPSASTNMWNFDNSAGTLRIFKENFTATGTGPGWVIAIQIDTSANTTINNSIYAWVYWFATASNVFAGWQYAYMNWVSDRSLKDNILPLENSLSKLRRLNWVSWTLNNEAKAYGLTPGKYDIGLVAQDVEKVFPELVEAFATGAKKKLGVRYEHFIWPIIEAIKELANKNDLQDKKIEELEKENRELKSRLEVIEAKLQ